MPKFSEMLSRSRPPTVEDFKSLPTLPPHGHQQWGVYILVWEKEGERPAVYVGTGTNSTLGVKSRFNE